MKLTPLALLAVLAVPATLPGQEIEPGDPLVNEPVVSDVPALILAGQFDPITPSE